MRLFACLLVAVLIGCKSPGEIDVENANLLLLKNQALSTATQFRIERCENIRKHSIKCASECPISKVWHKHKWN